MQHPNTEGLEALAALCGGVSASFNGQTTQNQQNQGGTGSQQTTMTGNASNNGAQMPVHRPNSAPQQQTPHIGYQHGSTNGQIQPDSQRIGTMSYAAGGQQNQSASQAGNLLAQQALNFYLQQQLIAAAMVPGPAQQQAPAQNIQQHHVLFGKFIRHFLCIERVNTGQVIMVDHTTSIRDFHLIEFADSCFDVIGVVFIFHYRI